MFCLLARNYSGQRLAKFIASLLIIMVCYEGNRKLLMSMKTFKTWRWLSRKRNAFLDGGAHGGHGFKMRRLFFLAVMCITVMLFIVYRITNFQYQRTEIEGRLNPFGGTKEISQVRLDSLPHGVIQARSDLELKPLWSSREQNSKVDVSCQHNLLAMAVGIRMKTNVDTIAQKFLSANFTIVLFHYDGDTNGWSDLDWSNNAIHIVAKNQTKWWFAKRFLHPDIVSIYDFIFLWDEDLGLDNFDPGRYLNIVRSEGLEISQPALDPDSTGIHHRITVRNKALRFHRRIYDARGSLKCTSSSRGPPCTGWVEGMAPVFSRAAWYCAWHLIQNDLVHGWGLDMKLGYCAQGDRTIKVGVVDSEYVLHLGIPTLGGSSDKKTSATEDPDKKRSSGIDGRVAVRRQASSELRTFRQRWEKAADEDTSWVDPYWSWFESFTWYMRRISDRIFS